jgi:biotin/methionine sulfoxide reductase
MTTRTIRPNLAHWGAFDAEVEDGRLTGIHPFAHDPDPSPILGNIASSVGHPTRVTQPMVRAGWLDRGPGASDGRGREPFVPVTWDSATELLAGELRRVYGEHGADAVFAGSYGWASAGRFHHAQSQLHRFLNCLGGYVRSVDSYSHAAGSVILSRVIANGDTFHSAGMHWSQIVEHTEVLLCFGGLPLKNTSVNPGGVFRHRTRGFLQQLADRGAEVVHFSPLRDDVDEFVGARWYPLSPGTDVAVMLALAHTLISERLHDRAFLERYCVGYDRLERYILGLDDGRPKDAAWAAPISEIPAAELRALAHRLAGKRVFVTTTWSLQRTEFGEQPPWMAVALAAILGQVGLPGGGYGFGVGGTQRVGAGFTEPGLSLPSLRQGHNSVRAFIPVARFADMLLQPGTSFDYNGERHTYPEIRLVYWAGGNVFHHHQHTGKLRRALARVETLVVHDPFWTAAARHADIVLPSTMTLERNDIGGTNNDAWLTAMHQAIAPHARSRNDYDSFSDLADALGVREAFTENRSEMEWLRHLYGSWRDRAAEHEHQMPDFDQFWTEGQVELPLIEDNVLFGDFRADPEHAPLLTPSGRIELFSATIDGFGYANCPGHPTWFERREWLGSERARQYPLLLIANNPRTRLHSQLDVGAFSQASKVQGREPLRMHPRDAAQRGIREGEVVRVFNDRGSFLAGVVLTDAVRPSVAQISTGAWYDPLDPADPDSLCVHGNANALTLDAGSSHLAQGSTGQHSLVQVEPWQGELPPVSVLAPPAIQTRGTRT